MSRMMLSVVWPSLLLAGCAQTVEVTSKSAAILPNTRIRRVAVLDVDGPEKYVPAATQRLIQRLSQSGSYQVVDEQTLQNAAPEALRDSNGKLRKHVAGEAGRRMRLDALLVSKLRTRDSRSDGKLRFGYPVVSASTMYTWVELPSGRIRDTHQAQHGKAIKGGGGDALPECVETSIDKLTAKLAPNLGGETHELAGSRWFDALGTGNRLAADGKWQAAEEAWTAVTRDSPDNAGAWYNLGIAAEQRGDHRLAHERFHRAAGIEDREQYRVALGRAEGNLQSHRIAHRPAH